MRVFIFALVFASACTVYTSEGQRARKPAPQARAPQGETRIPRAQLEPRAQLDGLIRHMAENQYENVGKVLFNRNFVAPRTLVHGLDLPAGRCFVAAGIAPHDSDLNLTVLAPNGRAVGHDVRRDAHPNVRFCTRVPGRYSVRVHMVRGGGGYYLALFEGPRHVNPAPRNYFAGHEIQEPSVQGARVDAATQGRIDALSLDLEREGYASVGPAQGLTLGGARSRDFGLNLQPGRCYVFATFAGPGVREANTTILTDEHEELARGEARGGDSVVEFCAPHEDDFTLRARILDGEGAIFVTGWQRLAQDAPQGEVEPPPATDVIAETSTKSATLEEAYALQASELAARGYIRLGEPRRGKVAQDELGRFDFTLETGKCYAALVVGGEGVALMRVRAEDRDGGLLDRHLEAGRTAIVRFCPEVAGAKSLLVHMRHGGGPVMVGVFTWPRGTQGPFGLEGVMYVRLAEMMQLLELEGYEPSMQFSPSRGTLDREGTTETHTITLDGGRCYALVTVGDEHVIDLGLELKDGETSLAGDLSRNAFPSVRHCASERRELTLEVTAERGRGDYFYQLFERDPS